MADLDSMPSAPPHAFGHAGLLSRAAADMWPDINATPGRRFS
jgi:hypothetical protein